MEVAVVRVAGFGREAENFLRQCGTHRSGQADDTDTTAPGWGRYGANGVGVGSRQHDGQLLAASLAADSASIWRVMYHCWAIPRTLLDSQYRTRPAGNQRKDRKSTRLNSSHVR